MTNEIEPLVVLNGELSITSSGVKNSQLRPSIAPTATRRSFRIIGKPREANRKTPWTLPSLWYVQQRQLQLGAIEGCAVFGAGMGWCFLLEIKRLRAPDRFRRPNARGSIMYSRFRGAGAADCSKECNLPRALFRIPGTASTRARLRTRYWERIPGAGKEEWGKTEMVA